MGDTATELFPKEENTRLGTRLEDHFLASFRQAGGYHKALLMGAVLACLSVALVLKSFLGENRQPLRPRGFGPVFSTTREGMLQRVPSSQELIQRLKEYQLWELPQQNRMVPPVVFANFPSDLDRLEVELKKKLFLHTLLPTILVARAEVKHEREMLLGICAKFRNPAELSFSEEIPGWQERLTARETAFLEQLTNRYRSERVADLLIRVDTVPVSLIMAQAALESSWGSSRFTRKGNNLFGLWTWGEKGIVPAEREEGKNHKVAVYDTILSSVRAYLLNLNRLPAYRKLRRTRRETRDPLRLAEGLLPYSQRGEEYVAEIQGIIRYNQLQRFDAYLLQGETQSAALALNADGLTTSYR